MSLRNPEANADRTSVSTSPRRMRSFRALTIIQRRSYICKVLPHRLVCDRVMRTGALRTTRVVRDAGNAWRVVNRFFVMDCNAMYFNVLMFPVWVERPFVLRNRNVHQCCCFSGFEPLGGVIVRVDKLPVPICGAGVYNAPMRPGPIA